MPKLSPLVAATLVCCLPTAVWASDTASSIMSQTAAAASSQAAPNGAAVGRLPLSGPSAGAPASTVTSTPAPAAAMPSLSGVSSSTLNHIMVTPATGEAALSSGSKSGLDPDSIAPLRTTILPGGVSATAAPQNNSVESFFQLPTGASHGRSLVPSLKPNMPPSALRDAGPKTIGAAAAISAADKPADTRLKPGRLLWHVLDNIGVPMFVGNHDADLDPAIARDYKTPPLIPTQSTSAKRLQELEDKDSLKKSAISSNESPAHRIPEGELEGTDVSETGAAKP